MNKFGFLLLAAFASTNALASEVDAPFSQLSNIDVSIAEAGISESLSLIKVNAAALQAPIYEYAENVFAEVSADIEEDFLDSLEQYFGVRITSR